jgi:hypothetical protein
MPEKPKMTYEEACHAMQTGVAAEMGFNPGPTDPKHLRVGINVALRDHASLARLLVAKGVITEQDYLDAIQAGMNEEVERYRQTLKDHYGADINLY